MSNITQVVNTDKNMTTLKKGVHASDLDQLLSSTGPYTFFAPSNHAFEKLASGTMEKLLEPENKLALTSLLSHHILQGKINTKDLNDGDKLKTLDGKELMVTITGKEVRVDGALIENSDMKTTNGVMHSVDTVL